MVNHSSFWWWDGQTALTVQSPRTAQRVLKRKNKYRCLDGWRKGFFFTLVIRFCQCFPTFHNTELGGCVKCRWGYILLTGSNRSSYVMTVLSLSTSVQSVFFLTGVCSEGETLKGCVCVRASYRVEALWYLILYLERNVWWSSTAVSSLWTERRTTMTVVKYCTVQIPPATACHLVIDWYPHLCAVLLCSLVSLVTLGDVGLSLV